jgi:hypothetical protein
VLHFIENWEDESRKIKSPEKEFKLLHKYPGLKIFDDEEEKVYIILNLNLEWKKEDKRAVKLLALAF